MKSHTMFIGLIFVPLLASTGCGNGVADDPLAGTWKNTACFGQASKPADIASCSTELTFANSLDIELKAETISLAATANDPGCTTTRLVTGQTWTTDHAAETVTVSGQGKATVERTNCVHASDNMAPATTTDIDIPEGDTTYTLKGNTLTVTSGSLAGVYTR